MLIFDSHCDILSKINTPSDLLQNQRQWDIKRARKYGTFIQVLTTFADDAFRQHPDRIMLAQMDVGIKALEQYSDSIKLIKSKNELTSSLKQEGVYAVLGAEGAEILNGSLTRLEELFARGLRILTLVWNYDNEVCDSVAGKARHGGLSSFGRKVIQRMQDLGIVVDLSHASDKTFEDVINLVTKPITASHSNARALCSHRRNLTDWQIKKIAESGGVIGINLYPPFLSNSGNADILSIIRHIEYMASLVGTKAIGLGCDFDGVDALPQGITGVESIEAVLEVLARMNYPHQAIEDMAGFNYVRLFTQVLN